MRSFDRGTQLQGMGKLDCAKCERVWFGRRKWAAPAGQILPHSKPAAANYNCSQCSVSSGVCTAAIRSCTLLRLMMELANHHRELRRTTTKLINERNTKQSGRPYITLYYMHYADCYEGVRIWDVRARPIDDRKTGGRDRVDFRR